MTKNLSKKVIYVTSILVMPTLLLLVTLSAFLCSQQHLMHREHNTKQVLNELGFSDENTKFK